MPPVAELLINLGAVAANYRTVERATGRPVHPVVKADAYGLGAAALSRHLMSEGARTFFVARAAEGVALRAELGTEPDIYVLDGAVAGTERALIDARLRPVLNHSGQVQSWRAAGGGFCGLQIDTGMNRLGFRPGEAPPPFDGLALVMSHLACADEPAEPMNRRQRDAFAAVSCHYPNQIKSFANSGGCFLGNDYGFDAVRPGICLYGGGPEGRPDARIAPVATLTARVLQVRDVPAGESIGYGRGFLADRPARIALLAAGYADGVGRGCGSRGQAFVAGKVRPLIGRVSMDVAAVEVTGLDVAPGDPVELFGRNLHLEDVAQAAGTIAYELLTSVTARVTRAYQ